MTSLERSVAKSVMYYNTARDIWLNLEERFGQSSSTQLYHVQQDPAALTQGGHSIVEYYVKAKALWNDIDNIDPLSICTCNGCLCDTTKRNLKQLQNHRIINFLMHLDEQFSQIRTNILIMDELPTHSQVYKLLMQEQRHNEVISVVQHFKESMAFLADKHKFNQNYSHKNPSGGKRNNYFCNHCKISGHSLERCFKIYEYPPSNKSSQYKRPATNVTVKHSEETEQKMDVDNSAFQLRYTIPYSCSLARKRPPTTKTLFPQKNHT